MESQSIDLNVYFKILKTYVVINQKVEHFQLLFLVDEISSAFISHSFEIFEIKMKFYNQKCKIIFS